MYQELLGVPGMNLGLAKTRLNEAFLKIQNENVFSFQCVTGGWLTAGLFGGPSSGQGQSQSFNAGATFLSPGTISIQPFQNIVVCDAVASAALIAYTGFPLITQQQFRVPYYSIYNIIGIDPTDPNAVTLKLDRPWMEPAQPPGSGYMLYQCYFPLPPGAKRIWNVRDTTNNNAMNFWSKTQIDLAIEDAERTVFDEPLYVVPYQIDTRPNSATLGQQLVELWPGPLSQLPYTFMCQCNWAPLVNPTDNLPFPLSDELVKERAYETISLWKESQKGDDMERGSGANWQFLVKAHHEEYKDLLRQARIMDRHLMELYFTKAQQTPSPGFQDGYATLAGQLNIGTF